MERPTGTSRSDRRRAVHRHFERGQGRAVRNRTGIVDPDGERDFLVENGKGRRGFDNDTPIPVGGFAGQQHMHRRGQVGGVLDIVNPAIADQEDTGDP